MVRDYPHKHKPLQSLSPEEKQERLQGKYYDLLSRREAGESTRSIAESVGLSVSYTRAMIWHARWHREHDDRKAGVRVVFALLLLTLVASAANAQANCWWDYRGMHCREGYSWQERREWREHKWREREEERARRHWEWEHSGRWYPDGR